MEREGTNANYLLTLFQCFINQTRYRAPNRSPNKLSIIADAYQVNIKYFTIKNKISAYKFSILLFFEGCIGSLFGKLQLSTKKSEIIFALNV